MAAGLMRLFGRTTKGQFIVLGLVLVILGVVGAALVLSFPNEDPVSPVLSSTKESNYRGISIWAVFGLVLVAVMGVLLIGACGLTTLLSGKDFYLSIAVAWGLLAFVGTLALAKHLEGKPFDE